MIDAQLNYALHLYKTVRDKILAEEPEIDERTLADTTEGLTDFPDLLAAIVRAAINDEVLVTALELRMKDLAERCDRFARRAERRRKIVHEAMTAANLRQLAKPDFTATLRQGTPRVLITDEKRIPAQYWEPQPPRLRKREINDALRQGDTVEGAVLSNPETSLTVRTK